MSINSVVKMFRIYKFRFFFSFIFSIIYVGIYMIRIKEYLLEDKRVSKDMRILVVSDVHSDVAKLERVARLLEDYPVDLILFPGDIFDTFDNKNNTQVCDIIGDMGKSSNVVVGRGNHDLLIIRKNYLYVNNDYRYFSYLENECNVKTILADEVLDIDGLEIVSLALPFSWYKYDKESKVAFKEYLDTYFSKHDFDDKMRIMLLHSANGLLDTSGLSEEVDKVNLIVSGHNHAGLLPNFLQPLSHNRGLIGPNMRFFMPNSYGYFTKGDTSLVMSSGLTKMGVSHSAPFITKLTNKLLGSDVDLINLSKGDEHKLVLKNVVTIRK